LEIPGADHGGEDPHTLEELICSLITFESPFLGSLPLANAMFFFLLCGIEAGRA
jgi:hypothetical protein